ncbi:GNAT family N-acetyltransferase [Cohnella sp. JJ-181]|uniref:GNAT family N-acetyltransferase n=1 Tax=Cohnella rhizoplanae TaxID=2974897 RepID=UPI0022FF8333|nr:GNAT family N-acetyltransferase [Cohnella sp. JJ-181]CAI6083791.1 Mycothiol acetyltransferase [Cohnella sp. JJ-181]
MLIRVLEEADAEAYRQIRLEALMTDPDAYGSTYERESRFTLEMFAERIKRGAGRFVLGAEAREGGREVGEGGREVGEGGAEVREGGALAGIATFVREEGMKTAHKGNVYGVYVAPHARGAGVGKALMLDLIRRARALDGMEQINLAVMSGNLPAKRLYASLGFEVYGTERRAIKYGGRYFDEDWMALRLR